MCKREQSLMVLWIEKYQGGILITMTIYISVR